ncbi:substrate-binding periplasmic protein [Psychromonas sp. KJ10-10]|uniref:substrate-binding periplasmic protein n=1 Tax=Psychromonas sp. KJ10-10 TaxID=3391823 RepID=UPI0039B6D451
MLASFSPKMFAQSISIATVNVGNRGFYDERGTKQGSSYEILNRIVKEAGFSYENEFMPFGRVLGYLGTGQVELSLLVPNETVNRVATPFFHIQDVDFIIVGLKDFPIERIQDIQGKRVGYLRLSPTANIFFNGLNIEKVQGGKYTRLIKMLMRDRIDVIFGPKSSILGGLRALNYSSDDLLGTSLSIRKQEMHLVYSKRVADESIIASLISSAEQLKRDNTIQNIIDKYEQAIEIVVD